MPIQRLRDFTRSYDKTSYRILKRATGIHGEILTGYDETMVSGTQPCKMYRWEQISEVSIVGKIETLHVVAGNQIRCKNK